MRILLFALTTLLVNSTSSAQPDTKATSHLVVELGYGMVYDPTMLDYPSEFLYGYGGPGAKPFYPRTTIAPIAKGLIGWENKQGWTFFVAYSSVRHVKEVNFRGVTASQTVVNIDRLKIENQSRYFEAGARWRLRRNHPFQIQPELSGWVDRWSDEGIDWMPAGSYVQFLGRGYKGDSWAVEGGVSAAVNLLYTPNKYYSLGMKTGVGYSWSLNTWPLFYVMPTVQIRL